MSSKEIKLSRRDFLKATAAGAGSLFLLGNCTETVEALTDNGEIVNEKATSDNGYYWYKDSIGRNVKIPKVIEKVIPTGHFAQDMIYTLCSDKLAAVASISEDEKNKFIESYMYKLPETGSLYRMKDERSLKIDKLDGIKADLIIDIGFPKSDLETNLNYLQNEVDTPVIFIDASLGNLPKAYRSLGKVLGYDNRAELLASYIEDLYIEMNKMKKSVDYIPEILYARGKHGLYKSGEYSIHNEVIKYLGGNPVYISNGNKDFRIDEKELSGKKIDYIIFSDEETFYEFCNVDSKTSDVWSSVDAIKESRFALSPMLHHSWFDFPFFTATIGMIWLGHTIWQFVYDYDMETKIRDYYKVFYNYDVTTEELSQLIGI